MSMTLAIDIGNTSAKLCLFRRGKALHFERLTRSWVTTIASLVAKYGRIQHAYISNVAGEQPELKAALRSARIEARWLTWQTPEAHSFINNIPEGLGADRLAADIGALTLAPGHNLLVVDAGTCLTFDVIGANGQYLGGSISPGIGLRLKAMHDHTAALPLFAPEGVAPVVGTNLEEAMRGGCLNGLRWEIEGYVRYLQTHGHPDLKVFYTGGNDLNLAPDVDSHVTHDHTLVMKGLLKIFEA